jgi:hypothetical protein
LWGWPFSFWEAVVKMSLALALTAGAVTAIAAFVAGYVGYELTDALQKISDEKVSEAGREAARANESAASANERAASLEKDAAVARQKIAEANARALEAQAELARFKAPRSLTAEQQSLIVAHIRSFEGQQYSALVAPGPDTWAFWDLLDKVLATAGWKRIPPPGLVLGDPPAGVPVAPEPGVTIISAPTRAADVGVAARALAEAIASQGIKTGIGTDAAMEQRQTVISIVIGPKPL